MAFEIIVNIIINLDPFRCSTQYVITVCKSSCEQGLVEGCLMWRIEGSKVGGTNPWKWLALQPTYQAASLGQYIHVVEFTSVGGVSYFIFSCDLICDICNSISVLMYYASS